MSDRATTRTRMAIDVEPITDEPTFARLGDDWDALFAETPARTGFQSFAWIAACRRFASAGDRRLFVLAVRDGSETIGIVPTELGPHGDLCFAGDAVSNYLGPVYRGARLRDVVSAVAAFIAAERSIRLVDWRGLPGWSPFLAAWRAADTPAFAAPRVVHTARCPLVDLSPGWTGVVGRRSSDSRNALARKWKALARVGRVGVTEARDPDAVRAALPAMFRMFAERWAGRHESGGFASRFRTFHEHAAPALAAAGHVRLSLLHIDGDPIAFSYGIVGERGTLSYVLAHDAAFATHSPGALLLARVLEAACERGDTEYDLSLGDEHYKSAWATGARDVFRVVRWRDRSTAVVRGALRSLGSRAWDAARAIGPARELRREGLRGWLRRPRPDET
ncbi:MAG TPA: GNAT family N-acetyltransferase, partial [Candidatus Binatia bacterium]|nr:GNAT family N-acetyltransferase [Candidatus Binatia bacterium]